jgi:hypothetical protein
MRRVFETKVTRITLGDLSTCHCATGVERRRDGFAEVSRGHTSRINQPTKGRT